MTTTMYRAHYVHAIAATACMCGHDKYGHTDGRKRNGMTTGHGPCRCAYNCDCLEYEPGERDDVACELPSDVVATGDRKAVTSMLRSAKLLGHDTRMIEVRREGSRLLCFPRSGWHSIVIEPWTERSDMRDMATVDTTYEVMTSTGERWPAIRYRIRWTRKGRCYVQSCINGGMIASYVDGAWDRGDMPASLLAAIDAVRPAAPRCGCESATCDHDAATCTRPADLTKRLMYVGAVCVACFDRTPAEYHLGSKP